jgi:hypothetical protein
MAATPVSSSFIGVSSAQLGASRQRQRLGNSLKTLRSGLPDVAIFSIQKSQFGLIFEGLSMENVCIFMVILSTYFTFYGQLLYFPVLVRCIKKNLATLVEISIAY